MRRFVDLHTHSTASDGAVSPAELVAAADRCNLAALALTDHDTVAGLAAARAAADAASELQFICGIEISIHFTGGTMHILGLGIDPGDEALVALTHRLQRARDERNPKIVRKLRAADIDISDDDVAAVAHQMRAGQDSAVTSRVHIAETLRRMGHAGSIPDAFERYLGRGGAAYVDKDRPVPSEAIAAIRAAGGLAVLAHPSHLNCANRAQLERVVRDLMRWGLGGIEAFHSDHSPLQTRQVMDLARRVGLGVSGGSDFHGPSKADVRLGHPRVPLAALTGPVAELVRR